MEIAPFYSSIHSPAKRTFLRNCPACQRRTGGAVLAPDRRPLQLICPHHKTWLVKADPPLSTHLVPEVRSAAKVMDRQQQRHTTDVINTLYADVRGHLTFQWRGLGWHTQLTKRWIIRQQILRPDADQKYLYALARTEHWSMLPETAAIISVLADSRQPAAVQTIHSQRLLTESLSHALHLDNHWPVDINPLRPWAMNPISLRHHHIFTEPSGRAAPRSQPVTVQVDPPEPMRCKRNETSSASIPSTNTVK